MYTELRFPHPHITGSDASLPRRRLRASLVKGTSAGSIGLVTGARASKT